MIEIRGQKVSEDTIVEALKKYCNFKEEPVILRMEVKEIIKGYGVMQKMFI